MIRIIFIVVVVYFVSRILRMLFDPMFEKQSTSNRQGEEKKINKNNTNMPKTPHKSEIGEYIDYEEVK